MKLRKQLITILAFLTVIVFVAGCAKEKTVSSKNSTKTTDVSNKPLTKLDSLVGKEFMSSESYSGSAKKSLDKISWKKMNESYSFRFVNNKRAFVGKYVNGKLDYGRFYEVSKSKQNFFNFKEVDFVTSATNYAKTSAKGKQKYTKIDNSKIPGATDKVQYYRAAGSKANVPYKLFMDGKNLVRENQPKKDVYSYLKYVVDKD